MERNNSKNVTLARCPHCNALCVNGHDEDNQIFCAKCGETFLPKSYEEMSEEEMMMAALDAGAIDFEPVDNTYIITTAQDTFTAVKEALESSGVKEFLECELTYIPNMEVELTEEASEKVHNLVETLEDLDDVQDVYYNLKED